MKTLSNRRHLIALFLCISILGAIVATKAQAETEGRVIEQCDDIGTVYVVCANLSYQIRPEGDQGQFRARSVGYHIKSLDRQVVIGSSRLRWIQNSSLGDGQSNLSKTLFHIGRTKDRDYAFRINAPWISNKDSARVLKLDFQWIRGGKKHSRSAELKDGMLNIHWDD